MNDLCPLCSRAAYLWGGLSCDHCDTDNDGLADKFTVGTGITTASSVVPMEEKGFRIIASKMESRVRIPISMVDAIRKRKSKKNRYIVRSIPETKPEQVPTSWDELIENVRKHEENQKLCVPLLIS